MGIDEVGIDKVGIDEVGRYLWSFAKHSLGDQGGVCCHCPWCWSLCSMYFELPWAV